MKPAVLADTGPLFAALDPDDQYHNRSQNELERLTRENREVVLSYPVLFETYTLALRNLGAQAANDWLVEVSNNTSFVNPTPEDYRQAIRTVLRFKGQKITLFDAIVAVLAMRLDLKIWTYDHDFDVMRAPVWR
jgi:predicted nucleic acid-binding protein